MAGREGDRVTSREIRERLIREARTNISIKFEDTGESTEFKVNAWSYAGCRGGGGDASRGI